MKKAYLALLVVAAFFVIESQFGIISKASENNIFASDRQKDQAEPVKSAVYTYPDFYRGIYLNIVSAKSLEKLKGFVSESKKSNINTFVMDCQSSKYKKCIVPPENVQYCLDNNIHPIARIVVFPEGLKNYPIPDSVIQEKLEIAESACQNGFKEIQFDYIRFNDSSRLKHLKLNDRYAFIEGFLLRAKTYLKKYNVKIAADIFGRIPLNSGDLIGQRMEGLDKVVDVICPMAYPSHYTWSKKLQNDPYHTVYITSKKAAERTKSAQIVTYIQAFKMKLGPNAYDDYVRHQIKAVHDAGVKGFIFWNARQDYVIPMEVARKYYADEARVSSSKNKADDAI